MKRLRCLALAALIGALYAPMLSCWFLSWDDMSYVYRNPLITGAEWRHWQAIWGAAYQNNYAPVTLLSYVLDWHLFGMQAAGFHAVNVLWHLLNAWLVYRLLRTMGLGAMSAWWGSALFALHPVQVETVAWVSERKNLLATAGVLTALLAHARTVDDPARRTWRLVSLLAGALAVLAKSSAVVLPVFCVAQDRWVHRLSWRAGLRRSSPFWVIGALGGLLTVWASRVDAFPAPWHGGSLWATLWTLPRVWVAYARLVVWPSSLSCWYDVADSCTLADGRVWWALTALAVLAVGVWRWQRRQPRVAWWACWIVVALLPTSNLVPLLPWMQDRYLYLPMVGVCGLLGEALAAAWGRRRGMAVCGGAAVLAALSVGTAQRVAVWRDPVTLWSDAVRRSPQAALPRVLLGDALALAGRPGEAQRMQWSAADVDPSSRVAWNVRGLLLQRHGDLDGAQAAYTRAQAAAPGGLQGVMALGDVAYARADWPSALEAYAQVAARQPFTPAMERLADIAQGMGRAEQAVYWYRRALRQEPWRADLHERLADVLTAQGRTAEAARARASASAWRMDYRRLAAAHRRAAAQHERWGHPANARMAREAAEALDVTAGPRSAHP